MSLLGGLGGIGLGMAAATLGTIDLFLPGGFFEGGHSLEAARTAGFTTLVFAQLLNALNSRSEITSAFHRLFANAWLWGAIALGLVLQIAVVQIPFLNRAFNTVPMTLEDWGICVLMASTVVWLAEIRKWVLRRPQRPSSAVPGVRPLNT
jgi:magnesium-transporting ATPase (P-type)